MTATAPAFATVALDVDSTVAGIEGIDWLAARRGGDVAREISELTDRAMRGELPLEQVYGSRLARIRPGRADIDVLAAAYIASVATGCVDAVGALREAGVRVVLVSGGIRAAILPLAAHVGVAETDVHAVDIVIDAAGGYAGFDETSPLATSSGKRDVLARLPLPRPVLMVGDGVTDLAARPAVHRVAAFTGFVRREAVVRDADLVLASFAELALLVLPAA